MATGMATVTTTTELLARTCERSFRRTFESVLKRPFVSGSTAVVRARYWPIAPFVTNNRFESTPERSCEVKSSYTVKIATLKCE